MANIEINKKEFSELLGKDISDEELKENASLLGAHWNPVEDDKWDVEVYPNRPDLLSVEGLARAYRGFFEIDEGMEHYTVEESGIDLTVDNSVESVRPYIGAAVVRGLELDQRSIEGLIQLQEKMHETMGRRRDKLAIGLHDLSTVEAPFTYRAVEPERVAFKPLEYDREMELGTILDEHEKGQKYSWILEDEDRYPIIEDSEGNVLSFPPIINNQLTEVDGMTEDVLVEVTGKDEETVKKALNIMVAALEERGGDIESVEVEGETLPDLSHRKMELDMEYLKDVSGLILTQAEVIHRLEMMKHGAEKKGDDVVVRVPPYRTDIMHQYDLIEDVVIAHGYDNIEPRLPDIPQVAEQKDIEEFTSLLRETLVGKGALEAHTFILSSKEKLFDRMERSEEDIVEMSNALTENYSTVRNWLLPSLFQVLEENRQHSYPQEFFEVEDVSVLDNSSTGASNRRKLAYVISDDSADFTDARQTLQVLERDLGVEFELKEEERNWFADRRAASISLDDEEVGQIGEFSEKVRENWGLERKIAGFEIDIEKLMELK